MDEAREDLAEEQKEEHKKKPKRLYEAPKEEEFVKLIENTKKINHQVAFILAAGAGLRLSEVIKLKPEDVDIQGNKIFLRQAKGSKDRMVNLPKWFKEKHLKVLPLKISDRAIEAAFLRNSLKAGINSKIGEYTTKKGKVMPLWKYRFHSLRHLFTLRALGKGLLLPQVQVLLGHQNISTTSRYANVSQKDAIDAAMEKGL